MRRLLISVMFVALAAGCNFNGKADMSMKTSGSASTEGGGGGPGGDEGGGGGETGTGGETLNCDAPTPGAAPMRRLSHVEYRYVIEDLFGNATLARTVVDTLVDDPVSLGFSNSAQLLDVKPVLGQQYMEAAEKIAESATNNLTALLPCDPAQGETACATQFINTLGRKAFRRSLTPEETNAYVSGYSTLRAAYDFRTGIEWVVATMLQSPAFLYRVETDDGVAAGTVRPVEPLEMASRLSFFIWHSIPDAALIAAAEEGRLATKEDVERETRRMLADPKGTRFLNFFEEWLDVDKLGQYPRDPALFGTLPQGLTDLFRRETQTFVRKVIFEEGGNLDTLLTADFTYANDALAAHYGLPQPGSNDFVKVALPAERRGLWMQGGPLTSHDKATRTSIVNRGLRVRTAMLCQNIPSPPDDVNLELGPVDQNATQADRLAQHRSNPSCSSCHQLLDPPGQLFENIDAVGRIRSVDEGGNALQTSVEITSTRDLDGAVSGAAQFLARAAQSEQVRQCFATQMFRYVHGREEKSADACSQKQAYDHFANAGFDVKELVVGIVLSDNFLYRTAQN